MHNRGTALGCAPDRFWVQQILPVGEVKAHDLVAPVPEEACDRDADEAAVPGDEKAHPAMIRRCPGRRIGSLAQHAVPRVEG